MIYIIFTMATIINIFNILLIANNKICQNIKEKTLLVTYSITELIYIIFILSLIEYTSGSTVFIISFISIWLLSKAYISVINIKFDEIELKEEKFNVIEENTNEVEFKENYVEAANITAIEKVEENNIQVRQCEDIEEIRTDGIVENETNDIQENVEIQNTSNDFFELVSEEKIEDVQKTKNNRRSLALKISKLSTRDSM